MQSTGGLNKHNLSMEVDPYPLAGSSQHENSEVRRRLLGAPWTELVNRGYLIDPSGEGWFSVSDEGQESLRDAQHVSLSRSALAALELLSPELRRSQQFFCEGRFKPSVAVAFQRIENRLNEVRDASSSRVV